MENNAMEKCLTTKCIRNFVQIIKKRKEEGIHARTMI